MSRLLLTTSLLFAALIVRAGDEIPYATGVSDRVPAYLIEVPSSIDNVLIADASGAAMLRIENTPEGLSYREQRYMSVGSNGVGKQRAWDRKTPLGIYFMTEELDTSALNAKYGKAAFVLDYPNAWDRRLERTGYGIWLHGVHPDTPIRPERDTDGCIALPNEQLLSLRPLLALNTTPVVITRAISWTSNSELRGVREELHLAIERWRASFENKDIHTHLSLYDAEFSGRGMDKPAYTRYRSASFAAAEEATIAIDDLLLLRDPEASDVVLARFQQTQAGDSGEVRYWKRLYWRKNESGWQVIAEDAG